MRIEENILWLDIAVSDFLLVDILDRTEELICHTQKFVTGEGSTFLDLVVEGPTGTELEDEVQAIVNLEVVVEVDDVDVVERLQTVQLRAIERPSFLVTVAFHDFRAKNLVVLLVVHLVDLCKASLADFLQELVAIDFLSHELRHQNG